MNPLLKNLKEYWPLWGMGIAIATALTTYLGLPKRVETVEAGQASLEDTFEKYLRSQEQALAEQRGYQKALNQQMQQQVPSAAPPSVPSVWMEVDQDGYAYCSNGIETWWPSKNGQCE